MSDRGIPNLNSLQSRHASMRYLRAGDVPSGFDLIDSISLPFQGMTIVLARLQGARVDRLYYNILNPQVDSPGDDNDFSGWKVFLFPGAKLEPGDDNYDSPPAWLSQPQFRIAGFDLATVTAAAAVPAPADAAFCAVADETYLYCFRQADDGSLILNRLRLVDATPQSASESSDDTPPAPSFLLEPAWESRFQRSRNKDVPLDETDTLGSRDMDERPFFEPTINLAAIRNIVDGRFAVTLAPTTNPDLRRWIVVSTLPEMLTVHTVGEYNGVFDYTETQPPFSIKAGLEGVDECQFTAAPAATLYYQQEFTAANSGKGNGVRRAARLMVATPFAASGHKLAAAMAIYDFGLTPDGQPAAIVNSAKAVLADGHFDEQGNYVPEDKPSYPVPPAAFHVIDKLTTTAVVLGQLHCATTPTILAGDDGLVHLYYHEGDAVQAGTFRVAQFDTQVTRKEARIGWATHDRSDTGVISILARRPGPTLDDFTATVAASGVPSDARCDVNLDYGASSGISAETWRGVPRDITRFTAVLSGLASPDLADPMVRNGVVPYFDYAGVVAQARVLAGGKECFTLAQNRADVVLDHVSVAPALSPSMIDLSMAFSIKPGGRSVTVTWPDLPACARDAIAILGGDAAPSEYAYHGDDGDTLIYPLAVAAGTGIGTIFLFAEPGKFPDGLIVRVNPASSNKAEECDLIGVTAPPFDETSGEELFSIRNVSRDQAEFVKAVLQDGKASTLFFHVSQPQTSGSVPNQVVPRPAGLRQVVGLFAAVQTNPGQLAAEIDPALYPALVDQTHIIHSAEPRIGVRGMQAADALTPRLPASGEVGLVEVANPVTLTTPPASAGGWLRQDRPIALALAQTGKTEAMTIKLVGPKRRRLAPGRHMTFETWVKPLRSAPARIVSYRDDSLDGGLAAVRAEYQLGIDGQRNLNFAAYRSGQRSSYFLTEKNPPEKTFLLSGDFTWEAWVKPQAQAAPDGQLGLIMQTADEFNRFIPPLAIGLSSGRVPTMTYRAKDKSQKQLSAPEYPLTAGAWAHVAVTALLKKGSWSLAILVNGAIVAEATGVEFYSGAPVPHLVIGGRTEEAGSLIGALADLRYWNVWRSPAEIRNTMFVSLRDSTPGLQGYWPLSEDFATATEALNRAAATRGFWNAQKADPNSTITSPRDDYFASLIGSVGGAPILEVPAFLHATHWNHVAVTFEAGGALHLNPAASFDLGRLDSVNCGNEASLDVGSAFAIDAWIAVDESISAASQTIISKWGIEADARSFQFGLNNEGRLFCSLQLDGPSENDRVMTVTSDPVHGHFTTKQPLHVGCTFTAGSKLVANEGATGEDPMTIWTLTLFVSGKQVGQKEMSKPSQSVPGVTIHASTTDLLLGMTQPSPDLETVVPIAEQAYLRGTLGRTRLWQAVPTMKQMFPEEHGLPPTVPSPDIVLSEWNFTEGEGRKVTDKFSGNDGVLSSPDLWGTLLATSDVQFFANGAKIYQRSLHDLQVPPSANQFTLGAILKDEKLEGGLRGEFDETRLWDVARTVQQLADNRFRPIESTEPHLSGYWPFGVKGEPTTRDESDGGNDGTLIGEPPPAFVTSHAPVGTEGPWVRAAYGGVETEFQVDVLGRVAVSDYGSAHPDSSGTLVGTLKRLYGFTDGFGFSLRPGFTVGALDVVYLGQVQTAPQLIGYIEGAPPVPSENLSLPYYNSDTGRTKYFNTSVVSRTQTTKNSVTYTSSTGSQTQFSLKSDGGLLLKQQSTVIIGLTLGKRFFDNSLKAGPQISFSWQRGQDRQSGAGLQWSEAWVDTFGVTGEWEPKLKTQSEYLSPYIGRRFVPENVGYALVESLTADMFSLRLPRTGAMVSAVIVPNVEYGPDRNIIVFPIKSTYQTAGSLDGKIGLANDPAYGSAANIERKSYFNPSEAYRIRASIANERAQRLTQFEQTSRNVRDQQSNGGLAAGPASFNVDDLDDAQWARMNRGIANTYVWTSNGGLHTEQQEIGSIIESTSTGVTADNYSGGLKVVGEYAAVMIGGYGNLDFLGGATIQSKATASGNDSRTLSLNVRVDGESYLRTWDQDANDGKGGYAEGQAPGKVNAYRFITAYLPPSISNSEMFLKIIDDDWLRFSSDPNAVALRRARIDSNPAWRILHRVTYVSRVPPRQTANPSEVVADTSMRPPVNLEGNAGIIGFVRPLLGAHPSAVEIGAALTAAMIPSGETPSLLGRLAPWWDEFVKAASDGRNTAQADLLYDIRLNSLKYFASGYESDVFGAS